MIIKLKRYLGNASTLEVHDTFEERINCELEMILPKQRLWYNALTEARSDRAYEKCAWCLGEQRPPFSDHP